LTDSDIIEELLKQSNGIKPQDRTNVKIGAIIRILSILESWNNITANNPNQKEINRLNTIVQQMNKEHRRLIGIIRSQDEEIKRLATIIQSHEISK